MKRKLRGLVVATALAAALTGVSEVSAQPLSLKANLSGSNHVPPIQVRGTGNVVATFDPATRTLNWTINYSDLTGPPIAMHFHGPADATRNAGIAVHITSDLRSPITGSANLTESGAADLLGGRWYLNIHTSAHPAGELRGQMVVDTSLAGVPTQPAADKTQEAAARAAQEAAARAAAERGAQEAAARAAAERGAQEAAARAAAERGAQEAAAKTTAERARQEAAAKAAAERAAQQAAPRPATRTGPQVAARSSPSTPDDEACRNDLSGVMANETLRFRTGSTTVNVSPSLVGKLKAFMARCTNVQLEVAGHTDAVGAKDVNKLLSQRRAQSVVDVLVKAGIDRSKLVATGYGSEKPIDANDTPDGRTRNRRIEVTIR